MDQVTVPESGLSEFIKLKLQGSPGIERRIILFPEIEGNICRKYLNVIVELLNQ